MPKMSEVADVIEPSVIADAPIPPYEYAPPPIPPWALQRPFVALWYAISRVGDHGRLRPIRRLTHITAHIYLGGQINLNGWRLMQSWGVQSIVNMRVEWDDRRLGIDTPYYLWLPAIDGTPPALEQLLRGAAYLHEQIQAHRPTYVHCAGGLGRSPTQVIAYLTTRGFSVQEAVDFVMKRRPFIQLSPRQRQRLAQFAAYCAKQGISYRQDAEIDPLLPPNQASLSAS